MLAPPLPSPWNVKNDRRTKVIHRVDGHPVWETQEGGVTSHCLHTDRCDPVWMENKGGARVYRWHCSLCGSVFGAVISSKAVVGLTVRRHHRTAVEEEARSARVIDWVTTESIRRREHKEKAEDAAWHARHEAHLQTPKWKALRHRVMARANGVCEGCGMAQATDVHHLTYVRLGDEMLFDLVAVCRNCHNKIHGHA
jgi:5-methylcytosine-specific restriction endonuclease McrA